jgi:hypothetical protein
MMKIKLKKFSLLAPKVKITTGLKTISRESPSNNNAPVNMLVVANTIGQPIIGNLEILEE